MHLLLTSSAVLCAAILGVAVLLGKERDPSRWWFLAGMFLLGFEAALSYTAVHAPSLEEKGHWIASTFLAKCLLPCVWLGFSLSYSRGDRSSFLTRWRWILALALVLPLGFWVGMRGELLAYFRAISSGEIGGEFGLGIYGRILCAWLLIAAVLILVNLERTISAAVGVVRWRIKFLIVGIGLIFGAKIFVLSEALLFSSLVPLAGKLETGALLIGVALMAVAFFRRAFSRLDIYPSRAVLQSSLTVLLVGGYLLAVGVLAPVVASLGAGSSIPLEAFFILFSMVALAVLLLSDRFRVRMQGFVSRHFQRPEHDFRKVWTRFTEQTSGILERDVLCRKFVDLTSEIFQALSVVLGVLDESGSRLRLVRTDRGGSKEGMPVEMAISREMVETARGQREVFDLESADGEWAQLLREACPSQFEDGGNRMAMPLVAVDRLIGVIVLADRVNGVGYSQEERELLQCMGDQMAGSLLNRSLSDKLLLATEAGAFQTMATFFVHDLKNTASNLNLMLKNLPRRFDDPDYREDALRSIARTVDRINAQISGLGAFRVALDIEPVSFDLPTLVYDTLLGIAERPGIRVVYDSDEPLEMVADREQLQSILQNLILNGLDAMAVRDRVGEIRIETASVESGIAITIQDEGCGMTPEFIRDSLFRPFRTTKKQGLGVGMFQCKMMVEAHLGRIEVESESGKGTLFRLYFPQLPRLSAN